MAEVVVWFAVVVLVGLMFTLAAIMEGKEE